MVVAVLPACCRAWCLVHACWYTGIALRAGRAWERPCVPWHAHSVAMHWQTGCYWKYGNILRWLVYTPTSFIVGMVHCERRRLSRFCLALITRVSRLGQIPMLAVLLFGRHLASPLQASL